VLSTAREPVQGAYSVSSSCSRVAPLSIRPGEVELTQTPRLLPSRASWRVIPILAALFVVWASDGRILKLRDPDELISRMGGAP